MKNKFFETVQTIEKFAEECYDPSLPYHNFNHALKAADTGKNIVVKCREEGMFIDEVVVYYALLFHDAGYHEDHKAKGFQTKEEYAASLAEENLNKFSIDKGIIRKVRETILATYRKAEFITNEQKAVRAADLAELANDYEIFLKNNFNLKKESEILGEKNIFWKEWKDNSKNMVEFYLSQDIRLTSAYADKEGNSVFHKRAKENLERFLQENEEDLTKKFSELIK